MAAWDSALCASDHLRHVRADQGLRGSICKTFDPGGAYDRHVYLAGGRLTITNYTLKMLIHEAYGVQDFQITAGPKWAGEVRYSIIAKPPADSNASKINATNPKVPPPAEELLMLRELLADRSV
jgi:uncharacterized protein (TIGR03435 family)